MHYFFFFQAEDGIRDRNVTGVQTCALPISMSEWSGFSSTSAASSRPATDMGPGRTPDRKSTRLNSSHVSISYAVFCLKKKKKTLTTLFYEKKQKKNTKTN